MDVRNVKPPDKGKQNNTLGDESELNEFEIKQEPDVKLEPEDVDMVTVPASDRAAGGSIVNSIGSAETSDTYGFTDVCELDEAKSELKKEKMNKEAGKGSSECSGNESLSSSYPKNIRSNKNQKPSKPKRGSIGSKKAMKKVAKAENKPKAGIRSTKKKLRTSKGKGKQHKCSSCDYATSNNGNLKDHMRKHTGEKPFLCTHCTKRFTKKSNLQSHMRSHVNEFLFNCSNCSKGFSQSDEKVEHEISCKIRRFHCHLCKEYSTFQKTNLKFHMRMQHTGQRPFGCNHCSKKFPQQTPLERHMKTHINPRPLKIKCSVCYRNFSQRIEKDEHEAKCKRRGYECYVCKEFTSNFLTNLNNHMRTHTGERPFQCKMCQTFFSCKQNHQKHLKRMHKKCVMEVKIDDRKY